MKKNYEHLSVESRRFAYKHKKRGKSNRWIAKQLWVSPSTLSREFKRNCHPCPGIWKRLNEFEQAAYADKKARERDQRSKIGRGKFSEGKLRFYVIKQLQEWWSPEDIAGKALELIGEEISAKGIYNFIKRERPDLTVELCYKGVARRARVAHRRAKFKEGAPPKKLIQQRPKKILRRKEEGHYEIDLIHSLLGVVASVLTIVERKTRRTWYIHLPDRTAASVNKALLEFFHGLSKKPKTITVDNGSEFAELYKLEKEFPGLQAYFCEPYKSWQRGSVELANRKLRRYFPKKTDFSTVTPEQLAFAERRINSKPMKLHRYRTPLLLFEQYLLAA